MSIRHTEFEQLLEQALTSNGKEVLPNVKEIVHPVEALRAINSCSYRVLGFKRPYQFRIRNFDPPRGEQTHEIAYYPKFFLREDGMSGQFDGSGVILASIEGEPRVYSFAMCEHVWDVTGANHSRGWHPKRCTKCGFDASIDSGD